MEDDYLIIFNCCNNCKYLFWKPFLGIPASCKNEKNKEIKFIKKNKSLNNYPIIPGRDFVCDFYEKNNNVK